MDEPRRDPAARGGECLVERVRRPLVDALAVPAQDVGRLEPAQPLRWEEPEEWMDAEAVFASEVVRDGAERVAADEYPALRPPQRDLGPEPRPHDPERLERRSGHEGERRDVERDAEPPGQGRAVAPVPVEQLDDPGRLAERAHSLFHTVAVDRVDQPHLSLDRERVRAALQELRLARNPADSPLLFVAEANVHHAARARVPSRSSITRTASGLESTRR